MAWKGVITNAGDALLKKWPSGGVLELCRAAAGTGRVEEALLMAQTSLVNERQEMGILSTIQTDDGPKLKLRLNVPEEGFALSQYGVWAKLDGGEAVLLAIYQNDADIPIPSVSEEPDFEYVMYATICFTNLGKLTVTIKPSTTVSKEDMDEYVEGYVADALAGLDINEQTPSYEEAETLAPLSSGEKLSAAFGKIAKAVKELIAHIRDVTSNPHKVTYTQTGAAAENHGTHVTYSTAAPKGAGTASAGTAATVARSDHVHPAQTSVTGSSGSCTGNAATATTADKTKAALTFTGAASGSWNGSEAKTVNIPPALGFTPVQQGGGSGQLTNKVYIGWSGSQLKAQVDNTDMGQIYTSTHPQPSVTGSSGSCTGNAATATNATNHINDRGNPHGVTLSQIGAAAASHTHDVNQVTGATRIKTGSYVGTGTYGESNPCKLTFDFKPDLFILFDYEREISGLLAINCSAARMLDLNNIVLSGSIGADVVFHDYFSEINIKTVEWFSLSSAECQGNIKGNHYYYLAAGC